MAELELRVCTLYPEHMSIYADRGNILFLQRRCEWRGIKFTHMSSSVGERIDPDSCDLIYIGGGQDRDQVLVARDIVETKRSALAEAVESGAVLLAVCGGYQLLGSRYELGDRTLQGLELVNLVTVREPGKRLIGNVAIEVELGGERRTIAGFENHGGRTYLDQGDRPLGRVLKGHGNNGKDKTEGVQRRNLIGTYLHGPLLPKNVWLADYLIRIAIERHAGASVTLGDLDDSLENAAHKTALAVTLKG